MATKRSKSQEGTGCLILFALPFAAVGVGMALWMGWETISFFRMRSWVETPATIVQAKLESHSGSEGGVTYEIKAKYTYEFQGQCHTCDRVSFYYGADNLGSFHEDAFRQLDKHRKSGQPMSCYVYPDDPSEAVLFRQIRWEVFAFKTLFGIAFGAAGFGMLAYAMYSRRQTKKNRALVAVHPDEPWLWKKEWAEGRIKSSAAVMTWFLVVFTFFWNLISMPMLVLFLNDLLSETPSKINMLVWLVLLFPLVGLIMILCSIVSVSRWRKYRGSVFEMHSVPGVIGGRLVGVIRVPVKVVPKEGFHLMLNCVSRVTSGSGKNRSTSESVIWQDEQFIARDLLKNDPKHSAIPVLFQIPYDRKPTDETVPDRQILWRLDVSAKTAGLDYAQSFEVPVFKTDRSDPNFVVDRTLIEEYSVPEDPARDLKKAGIIKERSRIAGGVRLVFPMARAPGMGITLLLVGSVSAAVPVIMYYAEAPWFVNLIFGVIFGILGLLLLVGSIDVWFYRSTVDLSPREVIVTGGLFGLGRERRIRDSKIKEFKLKSRMSSGEGTNKKVYYDIDIILEGGKKVTAGKQILGKRLAESVVRQMKQAMGKEEEEAEA